MSNGKTAVVTFGANQIMRLDAAPQALYWSSVLAVDADGHPQAYHPGGSPPGLDHLANAGKPGNWWGIATDASGKPFVQKDFDPAPGFYVSTTALFDPGLKPADPRRYVHSGEIPYLVLPGSPKFASASKLGDLAIVFNCGRKESPNWSWAVYADIGPAKALGEGSMRLAEELGLSSSPKTGGTGKEVIATIYWPGSSLGWPVKPPLDPRTVTLKLFSEWGGLGTCALALPQFNWENFQLP